MAEYISKKDAINALLNKGQKSRRYKLGETWELNLMEIQETIAAMPIADVQPTERVIEVEQMLEECERKLRYLLECEIESSSERHSITKLLDKIQVRYTKDGDTE